MVPFCCRKSQVVILDAKTMSVDPVAVVNLPTRVPYGFHGIFVSEVSGRGISEMHAYCLLCRLLKLLFLLCVQDQILSQKTS